MDNQDLIREFSTEGFGQITVHPGFVIGRRRSPRSIVFSATTRTVALYDNFKVLPFVKPGGVRAFEVEYIEDGEGTCIIAVRSSIDTPDDLAELYPLLEAILNTVRILSASETL